MVGLSASALGQESYLKVDDAKETQNKVEGDLDTEITNAKIRADSGSKSKVSMSTSLNYRGGAVSHPFGTERPNLSGLPENQLDTSMDGSIRARYRSSKNESYSIGVSLGMKTPFHGDVNAKENQVNVGDPLLGYNRTFAALGLQHSWNLTASLGTSDESQNLDQTASAAIDYTLMKAFQNGLNIGITASAWHNFYDSGPGGNPSTRIDDGGQKQDSRTGWMMTALPTLEYYFNDTLSFRTLFGYFRWRHLYGDENNLRMLRLKEYQSVGIGIVVSRDIYLYPNVQFLPREVRSDYTNFGVSAAVNVF